MFNVSIREYFSILNVSIVCNTARSKSIPLLCTHVDSYKFSTVHPPSFELIKLIHKRTWIPVDDKCCGEFIIFVCKFLKSPVLPRFSVMPVVNFWTTNWSLHRMLFQKDDISKLNTCSKWSSRSRVECPRHPQLKRENHTDATSTTYSTNTAIKTKQQLWRVTKMTKLDLLTQTCVIVPSISILPKSMLRVLDVTQPETRAPKLGFCPLGDFWA